MFENPEKLEEQKVLARKIAEEQYGLEQITEQYKKLFEKYM